MKASHGGGVKALTRSPGTIEGDTDNVGAPEMNQQLSQDRSESVGRFLIEEYTIDGSRLEVLVKGESEPAASNDTPEGRQSNRRVVLI